MRNALVRFVGWRLGTSFKPVRGTRAGQRRAVRADLRAPGRDVDRLPRAATSTSGCRRSATGWRDYLSRYHPTARAQGRPARSRTHRPGVRRASSASTAASITRFHNGRMYVQDGGSARTGSPAGCSTATAARRAGRPARLARSRRPALVGPAARGLTGFQHGRMYVPPRAAAPGAVRPGPGPLPAGWTSPPAGSGCRRRASTDRCPADSATLPARRHPLGPQQRLDLGELRVTASAATTPGRRRAVWRG